MSFHDVLRPTFMPEEPKFVGSRKMADVVVQYPIEALEGPVLHGRVVVG